MKPDEKKKSQTLYEHLSEGEKIFVDEIHEDLHLSFQELRQVTEACRDLHMWNEEPLKNWWQRELNNMTVKGPELKKRMFKEMRLHIDNLKKSEKEYKEPVIRVKPPREVKKIVSKKSDKTIMGMCPVASEKTVCCNLHTIDAVENCAFGCSYCSVQTFYSDEFVFDADLAEKLKAIELEPERFYHIGTGQSSDSLLWGNRNGNLDSLCDFARAHPNILLEFKTKSDNVSYFLDKSLPKNIVLSWSLNSQTVIENEEHFTASLDKRLSAARQVSDKGVKVAFHFHPMVYYKGWDLDYPMLAQRLMSTFSSDEVLFVSFGTVTLIKPVMKNVRKLGYSSKILQMDLVRDPHGKLTYPDEIKEKLFKNHYESFKPWRNKVFFYLCMEKAGLWLSTFGKVYETNKDFENDFGKKTMSKL